MSNKFTRKPIGHFFIKKELQIRLIKKIVFTVIISTIVCVATLLLTYLAKYKSAVFYRVTFDLNSASIGNRENIISIILPSLLISSIVNITIAIGVGLYASRKYAVPIFKLEQWVNLLRKGHMTAKLRFREKAEMKELCYNCNHLSEALRYKFEMIDKYTRELEKGTDIKATQKKIQDILDTMEFNAEAIEIQTGMYQTDSDKPD